MDNSYFDDPEVLTAPSSFNVRQIKFGHVVRIVTWAAVIAVLLAGAGLPWLRVAWPHHSVGLYSFLVPFLSGPINLALVVLLVSQFARIWFPLTSYVLELTSAFYLAFWSVMFHQASSMLAKLYVDSVGGQQLGPIHVVQGAGATTTLIASFIIIPGALVGLVNDATFGFKERTQMVSLEEWSS